MEKETIEIRQVTENKKAYLELLLLADEQESMIDRYLDRGTMYVLEDDGVKAECVVTDEGNGILKVGTGDSPLTVPFYEACGFVKSYVVPGFFTEHYDHPIYEGGKQLVDMIYLQKTL